MERPTSNCYKLFSELFLYQPDFSDLFCETGSYGYIVAKLAIDNPTKTIY